MPTPSVIDIDSLLKPISGENPAGKDVDKDRVIMEQLTAWRIEDDPANYAVNDPNRPKVLQPARWADIIRLCKEQLAKESKYPTLGAFMTEALTRLHGFAGARDGFILQRRLAEQFMESLYPNRPIEEESDINKYLNGINWLSDKALLDVTLKESPLLKYINPEERLDISVALSDLRTPQNQTPAVDENKLSAFLLRVPAEIISNIHADIKECQVELDKLLNALAEKTLVLLQKWNESMAEDKRLSPSEIKNIVFNKVPGLTRCKEVLTKALTQSEEMSKEKANAASTVSETTGPGGHQGTSGKGAAQGQSREQLYEQLRQIAKQLEKIDAHSPVPLLVLKAVQLREMNFPKLVDILTRDAKVLQFINSEEPPAAPAS